MLKRPDNLEYCACHDTIDEIIYIFTNYNNTVGFNFRLMKIVNKVKDKQIGVMLDSALLKGGTQAFQHTNFYKKSGSEIHDMTNMFSSLCQMVINKKNDSNTT